MKKSEVQVGMKCRTKVNGGLVTVTVIAERVSLAGRTVFELEHNGKPLPKFRAPAALHPVPGHAAKPQVEVA